MGGEAGERGSGSGQSRRGGDGEEEQKPIMIFISGQKQFTAKKVNQGESGWGGRLEAS